LVFVAAFAPDANQNITEISKPFPPPPGLNMVKPLTDGFILLTPEGIETAFAQDLTKEEKALILAVQPQTAGAIFGAKLRQRHGTTSLRGTSFPAMIG
jgi:hypothetical protein